MTIRGLEIGTSQMRTLQLIDENGLYINLALLLSDQCEHTTRVAIFQGSNKVIFRNRKEFNSSLLNQLNEAYKLIDLFNKTKAAFSGLQRIDQQDYPEDAVREALLNSVIHRDYSFTGSTLINLYDDRIESYGTGIGKIQRLYSDQITHPQFDTAKGVFRVILPNCNETSETAKAPRHFGF